MRGFGEWCGRRTWRKSTCGDRHRGVGGDRRRVPGCNRCQRARRWPCVRLLASWACAVVLFAVNLPAAAQPCGAAGGDNRPSTKDCATAEPDEPASLPGTDPATATANSIDLVTGNKYLREVDAAWPGGLVFSRHYNSRHPFARSLGRGWSHSYDTVLARLQPATGTRTARGAEVQLIQGDGRRSVFVAAQAALGANRYIGADPARGVVTEHPALAQDRRWSWRWPEGRTLWFDAAGRLSAIHVAGGDRLSLEHHPVDGRLLRVRNRAGATLSFEYFPAASTAPSRGADATEVAPASGAGQDDDRPRAAPGQLAAVVQPDGTRIAFHYDARGLLVRGRDADGFERLYRYDDPHTLQAITSVEDAAGRVLGRYAYDNEGRAVASEKADGVQRVSLAFRPPAVVGQVGETVVTSFAVPSAVPSEVEASAAPVSTTVYRWRYWPHEHRALIVAAVGPGCAACPPSGVERNYDPASRLVEERWVEAGLRDRFAYDRVGRIVGWERLPLVAAASPGRPRARGAAPPIALLQSVRFDYASDDPLAAPSRIRWPSVAPGRTLERRIRHDVHGRTVEVSDHGFTPDLSALDPDLAPRRWLPLERRTRLQWSDDPASADRLLWVDGPLPGEGDRTRYDYDDHGTLVGVRHPEGLRERMTLDAFGRIARWEDVGGRVTSIERSMAGRVRALVVNGRRTEMRETAPGLHQLMRDGALAYTLRLDANGQLVEARDAIGDRMQIRRDSDGRAAAVQMFPRDASAPAFSWTAPPVAVTTPHAPAALASDTAAQRVSVGLSVTRRTGGRVEFRTPSGRTTVWLQNDFGHRVAEASPERGVSVFRYDAAGRQVASIDAAGFVTVRKRDQLGREVAIGTPGDPLAVQRSFSGMRLTWESDPWQTRAWVYDDKGRVAAEATLIGDRRKGPREATAAVISYTYDALDRVVAFQINGLAFGLGYVGQDRLSAVAFRQAGGAALPLVSRIEWPPMSDAASGIRSASFGNGVDARFERDAHGVITSVSHRLSGGFAVRASASARFSGSGNVTVPSGPVPTLLSASTRSDDGRFRGNVFAPRRPGAADENVKNPHGDTAILDLRLLRNDAGEIVGTERNGRHEAFVRDARGRITGASTEHGVEGFAYDADGNRTAWLRPSSSQVHLYAYDRHGRLTSVDEQSMQGRYSREFRYGATGILTHERTVSMETREVVHERAHAVSSGGRRSATADRQGAAETYAYNASGERVALHDTNDASKSRRYLYRSGRLFAVLDVDGAVDRLYLHVGQQPLAMLAKDRSQRQVPYWLHADHLGTVDAVTDATGRVVHRRKTTLFGAPITSDDGASVGDQGELDPGLRFAGQHADARFGLWDNYRRTYEPATGRYIEADPLGPAGGPNAYAYAGGDPVGRSDPLGLYDTDVHYYMTFFLARVAGLNERTALTIASATQFIDDNPSTRPIPRAQDVRSDPSSAFASQSSRLMIYHFTQSGFDPIRLRGETFPAYAIRRVNAPMNPQVQALLGYANAQVIRTGGGGPCARAQLFGEFLHAFEDTFAHRNEINEPIDVNLGVGHALYGHSPDRTFNHRADDGHLWSLNESRTLAMERMVFSVFQTNYGLEARDTEGFPIRFEDVRDALVRFNAIPEEYCDAGNCWPRKIALLNETLSRLGLGRIPEYDPGLAAELRTRSLQGLQQSDYPRAILRTAP